MFKLLCLPGVRLWIILIVPVGLAVTCLAVFLGHSWSEKQIEKQRLACNMERLLNSENATQLEEELERAFSDATTITVEVYHPGGMVKRDHEHVRTVQSSDKGVFLAVVSELKTELKSASINKTRTVKLPPRSFFDKSTYSYDEIYRPERNFLRITIDGNHPIMFELWSEFVLLSNGDFDIKATIGYGACQRIYAVLGVKLSE